jgi:hypothetical protein
MGNIKSYQEFNEGWKNILAGALIGLTTACQKVDFEDEVGNKIYPTGVRDVVTVTFVDSLSPNKFRIEAKTDDKRIIYFDNPISLTKGQKVFIRTDDIGRLLTTPVGDDFEIPDDKSDITNIKLNFSGKIGVGLGKWNKVKVYNKSVDDLLNNLSQIKSKIKSKYIAIQIDMNGNIVDTKLITSLKDIKPQENLVILKGQTR